MVRTSKYSTIPKIQVLDEAENQPITSHAPAVITTLLTSPTTTITTATTSDSIHVPIPSVSNHSHAEATTGIVSYDHPDIPGYEVNYTPVDTLPPSPSPDAASKDQPPIDMPSLISTGDSQPNIEQIERGTYRVSNSEIKEDDEEMDIDSDDYEDSEIELSAAALSLEETPDSSIIATTSSAAAASPALQQQTNTKLKPVFITSNIPFMELMEKLHDAIGSRNFVTKSTHRDIQITCKDIDSKRKLIEFIDANKMEYYTHMDSQQTRVLIKGLNYATSPAWIRNELSRLGFNAVYLAVDKNRRSGNPLDAFNAVLENTPNVSKIFQVNKLGNQLIRIERSIRHAEPMQCHHCQQFGHSKNGCKQKPACLKCAGGHDWKQCNKPSSQEAKCANCGGNHTANYRGCSAFKTALSAINRLQQQQSNRQGNNRPHLRANQAPATTSIPNQAQIQQLAIDSPRQPDSTSQRFRTLAQNTSNFMTTHQRRQMQRIQHFRQLQDEQRRQRHNQLDFNHQSLQQQLQLHHPLPSHQRDKAQRRQQRSMRSLPTHLTTRNSTPDNLILSLQQDLDKLSNYIQLHGSLQPEFVDNISTLGSSLHSFLSALSSKEETQPAASTPPPDGNNCSSHPKNNYISGPPPASR